MTNLSIQPYLFTLQLLLVFFVSRFTIKEFFTGMRSFIKSDRTISLILAMLFLPGTIIHELAHFLTAMVLFLKVGEIKIFPTIEESEIKLGKVTYERKDPVRGILVGVAPLFTGLLIFFLFAYFQLFPSQNIFFNILIGYLVFTISTTMFSSRQDLVDVLFLIPFFILIIGGFYIFDIKIDLIVGNQIALEKIMNATRMVNFYLFVALLLNALCIFILKVLKSLGRK